MKSYQEFINEAFQRTGKKITFVRLHHGSDEESIKSIKKSGPKESSKGSQGPGHYVTTDSGKAKKYAEFTSKNRNKKPGVVSYLVSKKSIRQTSEIPKGLTDKRQTDKDHPVVQNTKTGHSVIDAEYANRKMIRNPQPIIRKPKRSR